MNPKNKDFSRYGGAGIDVCERWLGKEGYQNFLADMGRRPSNKHSLDRIDNCSGYSPSNCRWATLPQQRRNQERYKQYHPSEEILRRWLLGLRV